MQQTQFNLSLVFDPLLPPLWLMGLGALCVILLLLHLFRHKKLPLWRMLVMGSALLALLNPALSEEDKELLPSTALVIVDESPSQSFKNRTAQSEAALAHVQGALRKYPHLETRVIKSDGGSSGNQTNLYRLIEENFSDVPEARRAGVILITDGQIHDLPEALNNPERYGPIHGLISGETNERDRRINIIQAPGFGITGQKIAVKFSVEDYGVKSDSLARVNIRQAGEAPRTMFVRPGEVMSLELPTPHAGQNIAEIAVDELEGEITYQNNRSAIAFQGIRERLKTLLVSGRPHSGGRAWRDLLTADPSVDLVHFTILRDPQKIDATPPSEMSLIAFPFRELFEIKLYDFDLIIFDRYSLHNILPPRYFENIVKYVRKGGGFLEVSGPSYAGEASIHNTALSEILPAAPSGEIFTQSFTPEITEAGKVHPVTQSLTWNSAGHQAWGDWMRQIGLQSVQGDVLMQGANEAPLLILNRIEEGRVAQLASDQIWLWARGYQGGGPHADLLRRSVHWLMKEPELDEQALKIQVEGDTITLERPAFEAAQSGAQTITLTSPSGAIQDITLQKQNDYLFANTIKADEIGLYEFVSAQGEKHYAIVGEANPPEYQNVLSTMDKLAPIAQATGGGLIALHDHAAPGIRLIKDRATMNGKNWLGLKRSESYTVKAMRKRPVLPFWGWCLLICSAATLCWWREGRLN